MSTRTTKFWDIILRNKRSKSGFSGRLLLLLLTFVSLSSFSDLNENHFNDIKAAATSAAFDGCENNLLMNGDFEFDAANWLNNSNSLQGVASSYTSDGNAHAWLLPLSGTGQFYQDINVDFSNQAFSLMVNAGVHDPSGSHFIGLQFLNSTGTVLSTESIEVNNDLDISGSLQAYTITGTPPSGASKIRVFGSSDSGYLRMDNFCLGQLIDDLATPSACTFDLGVDQEYCGESIGLTGPPRQECQGSNAYLWTKNGKPIGTFQNSTADGIGTYCLTFTDCDGCQTTDCIDITECVTGSPAVTTQSTFCGSTSWTSCNGTTSSNSNLSSNISYNTVASYRPCGIELDGSCNVSAVEFWHCIDGHLDIPTAYTRYTRTNYSGVGISALQAARLNWIVCNYAYNQSGVAQAVWAITNTTGGLRNTIYNQAVSAVPSADGSQTNMVFYKSSISTFQDMIQWECQNSCNVTARAGSDKTICEGASTTLSASGSNGTFPYTYSWSEGISTTSAGSAITVQAESGNVGGGARVESVQSNYNGSGYVEFYAANGEYSEVTVNAPEAGNYSFDVRYAYSTAGTVNMRLVINGITVTNTASFIGTSSGNSWEYQCFGPYYFRQGSNTVRFVSNSNTGVDIDEYVFNFTPRSSNSSGNSISVSPTSRTTYTVTVTDSKGCTDTDQVIVNVNNSPTITNISKTNGSCDQSTGSITFTYPDNPTQSTIEFSIDGGVTYPTRYSVFDNTRTFSINNLSPGTYDLWVRWGDDSCPLDLNDVTISADSEAVITNVSSTNGTCGQSNGSITISFNDDPNRSAIEFSINGGITYPSIYSVNDNNRSITLSNLAAGTYDLWARWGNDECPINIQDATITAPSALSVRVPDVDRCDTGIVTLTASPSGQNGSVTYRWSTGQSGSSIQVNATNSSTYTVTATDSEGCTATDQARVTVVSVSANAGNDQSSCNAGDCFMIGANPVGPNGATYSWSSGINGTIKLNGNNTDNGQIQVCPTRTTTYSLTISNNGCTATDEVTVMIGTGITANDDSYSACCGEIFTGSVGDNDSRLNNEIYQLTSQPSNGTVTLQADGSFIYEGIGDCNSDQFQYKVCNDNNVDGCCDRATVTLNISPEPTLNPQISNPTVCSGEKSTISVSTTGGTPGYTYSWDNNLGTGTSFEVMPTTTTTYRVTVTDANGCTDATEITAIAETCEYDLALIKTLADGQASTVTIGDQVVYNITVANQGEVPSNDYTVTDRIPAGMSYVTSSDGGIQSGGTVTWANLSNLDPGQKRTIILTLRVEDATQSDYRNWAEISDDSSEDYGTTDEDSTPDVNVGNDSTSGLGTSPNDQFTNHNDISLDNPLGDEDDNDYEDIQLEVKYDLALIKTLADGQTTTVGLGDLVTYKITIANQGNVASNQYTVRDQIPAGMSFVSASDNAQENNGVVTWSNLNNLDPGQTKQLSIILKVDNAAQGDYRNWAEISSDGSSTYGTTDEDSTPDSNIGNDNAAGFGNDPNDRYTNHNDISLDEPAGDEDDNDYEDISVAVSYDLALIKTLSTSQPNTVSLGDLVTYNITIANQGNVPSNSYSVTDQIPAGMSFVSASDFGNESGGVVTWSNLSNLNSGSTKVLTLVLRVDDATQSDYRNWAEISADSASDYGTTDEDSTPDNNVGNDNADGFGNDPNDPYTNHNDITLDEPAGDEDDNDYEDIKLEVKYDLALIKTLGSGQPTTVGIGDLVTYNITVSNQGNVPSNNYSVTDQIPAGMSFVSASDFGNESSGVVTWSNLPNLNPGTTKVIALVLRVEDATQSDYRNWAEISADSASDYGTTDEDSTPDTNVGNDNTDGFGNDPNDSYTNHNDITLDEPAGDEDDNDYEDIAVEVNYDLALIKTLAAGQSETVGLGDLVTYTITIGNQGNVPSERYNVTDQIPAGMSFVSASDSGSESNGIVTWTRLRNIDPGQTKELSLILRVEDPTQSDYRNWAEISKDGASNYGTTDEDSTPDAITGNDNTVGLGTSPNDLFTNHNDITLDEPSGDEDDNDYEDITLEINYDLALVKTLGSGQATTVGVGDLVTYNITITNQGNVPSNDYSVIDQLPEGTTFISASDFGSASGSTVTWTSLPNLNPGDTKVLNLIIRVEDASQSDYRNWAEISSDSSEDYGVKDEDSTPDSDLTNDPVVNHNDPTLDNSTGDEDDNDFEDITVIANYDLALIKTLAPGQPSSVTVGEEVSFNIIITNQGNVPSNDYSVIDGIPAGMSFVSASDGGLLNGNTVTWSALSNLNPEDTKVLTITLRLDDATIGEYINRAEISSDSASDYGTTDEDSTPDSNLTNDPIVDHNDPTLDNPTGDEDDNDLEEIQVGVEYDLALIKTLSSGQAAIVSQGDNVSYDITIANQGNVESLTYAVTDNIPDGMSFVSATDNGTESGGIVTWSNLTNLPVGATKTLTIVLEVTDVTKGDFRNWAEISDDSSEDYNTSDEDSTPDTNTGNDNEAGTGTDPNDSYTNHNDITLDNPTGDEDDNDYEDVQAEVKYDLALIKTLGDGQPATVKIGDVVVYNITVSNQGNVSSNNYTITDQIPAGMSLMTTTDGGTANGNIITWNLTNLAPSETKTISLILRVDNASQGDYRNWAEISSDSASDYGTTDEDSTPDSNVGNDSTAGFGTDPNDPYTNHNDITLDEPAGDEDDNDYEDVAIDVNYDLSLVKALADGQEANVSLGDVVNYTITILNQGNVPSNDYYVTDHIPAGMSFVSASDFGAFNGNTVIWSKLSNLAPGQSKTLTISLRVTDAAQAPYENFAEISDDSSEDYGVTDEDSTPDSDPSNDPLVETDDPTPDTVPGDEDDSDVEVVDVNVNYDLALVKDLAAGQTAMVALGEVVDYIITITNEGNVPSGTYAVSDYLPAGMSYVSASDFGSLTGSVVTWSNLSNLEPGQTKSLTISLRVEDLTTAPFENVAEISDDSADTYGVTDSDSSPDTDPNNDPVTEDDRDPEVVDVNIIYDLALAKSLAPDQSATVALGEVVNYIITVANQGNVPSGTYDVADYIPEGMEFLSASDFGTLGGSNVAWSNLSSLAPGETKTLSIALRVTDAAQTPFENFAEITNDSSEDYGVSDKDSTPDADPTNDPVVETDDTTADMIPGDEDDSDLEVVDVNVIYDLALVKTLASGQASNVTLGELVNYTITVANQGNVPSNEYTVVDQIPAGMEYVGASDLGTHSGGIVTWANLANLDPGQTKTINLALRITDLTQGDFRNWAEISNDSSEDYGVTDKDSTPDSITGSDNTTGTGTDPNDPYTNHNDITLDDPAGDEDDNDYEDISAQVTYDLALVKALADGQTASASLGDVVDYTITIANQGNVPSNSYTVADVIPAGMEYVTASDLASLSGNTVTWSNLSSLDAGQTKTLTISLRIVDATEAPYVNFAEITADSAEEYGVTDEDSTPDSDPNNDPLVETDNPTIDMIPGDEDDSDNEPVDINIVYDLALVKTLADGQSATVDVGDIVTYNITVANQGNVPSNNYSVTDQLPSGLGFISASNGGTAVGSVVTWANLPSLAPGQTTTISLTALVKDGLNGDYRNWAEISDDSSEDYGVTDEDSTPDTNTGNDNADGLGTDPNDPYTNHNDITLDDPAGDEDDNDYEDISLRPVYDLALVKLLTTNSEIAEGEIASYSIVVTNQGTVASNDYVVTDFIPAGMSFVAASDGGINNGNEVTWSNLPNLQPGIIQVLTVTLRMDDVTLSSEYRNWAEISDDSSEDYGVTDEDSTPDNDPSNDPTVNHNDPAADTVPGDEDDSDYEDVTPIIPPPVYDLALIKTIAAGESTTLAEGDQVTYNITITNQGEVASNNYSVTDVMPEGMSFVTASDGGDHFGKVVNWDLSNLEPGQTKVLSITLRMDDPTLNGSYRNWAEISKDSAEDYGVSDKDSTPDDNVTNDPINNHNDPTADSVRGDEDDNDYEDVTPVLPPPVYDLALIKVLANGQSSEVGIGDQVTYSIMVTNQGDVASNDYTVMDVIPAGMSFVSASDFGSFNGGSVTWANLSNLDPGQTKVLTITLQMEDPTLGDSYSNFAEISDDSSEDYGVTDEDSTPDTDSTNDPTVDHNDPTVDSVPGDEDDSDFENITPIIPAPVYDLALVKTLAEGQSTALAAGDQVTYNITVTNQGDVASNSYTVIDQIPDGMSFVSASDFGVLSGNVVTWDKLSSIDPGQTKMLTITLQMDDTSLDSYRNWAEISDDSAADYGVTDEDSTPDAILTNDPIINHNDLTADNVAGDEDDNDYEDVSPIQPTPVYDLALIKVLANGQASEIGTGDQVTYNIIVTNQGTVASNDYAVTDVIPAGMSYVTSLDGGSHSNGIVTWTNLANLDPGQTKVLTITLQMDDPTLSSAYSNFAEISDDSSEDYGVTDEDSTPDTNPSNDPTVDHNDSTADTVAGDEDDSDIEEIIPIIPIPVYDLALVKTITEGQSTSIMEGDQVSYTITISNQGEVPSNDYTVVDLLPAGMSFVSASDNGISNGTTVTWANLPNIDPGQTKALSITLQLDDGSLGSYRNIAEITEDSAIDYGTTDEDSTTDSDFTNDLVINHNDTAADEVVGDEDDNDYEEFSPIQPSFTYDLALVKVLADGQAGSVLEGEVVNYNIFISNQGSVPSGDYAVTDLIPEGMSFVAASPNAQEVGRVVTWAKLPNIDPGQTEVLSITLRLEDASIGSYRNWAEISDDSAADYGVTDEDSTPDTNSSNDPVINHNNISADDITGDEDDSDYEDITPIQPIPVYDLALIKTLENGQSSILSVGDQVTYSIIVTNQGTVASNDYCVVDIIPAGMSYVSATDGGVYSDGLVNWIDLPNIEPGQTEILNITLQMDDTSYDSYRNFAEISDDSSEDYGVTDEDSTPDGDVNSDPVINHNDPNADVINGDEDDHDYEDVSSNPEIVVLLECPSDLTITCDASIDPANTGQAIATSNCTSNDVTITYEDVSSVEGSCANSQIVTRLWKATDSCGGISTCEQIITIIDDSAPILACAPDATVSCDGSTEISATGIATATDNCGDNGITITHEDLPSPNACGVITRVWTAADACGNSTTCQQRISIVDEEAPVLNCPNDITIDCATSYPTSVTGGLATATDNCSNVTVAFTDQNTSIDCNIGGAFLRVFTAIDDCGNQGTCEQIISVAPVVTVPDCSNFSVTSSGNVTICDGSITQLSASGGVSYVWSPSTGLDNPFSANPTVSPSVTTTYTVTATGEDGCTATASTTVSISKASADAGPSQTICADGDGATLFASGGVSYTWSPASGLSSTTAATPNANPATTTTYSVTVTNEEGCTAIDQVTIIVETCTQPDPCIPGPIAVASPDITICEGSTAQLSVTGDASYTYNWTSNTGETVSTSANPAVSPTNTTTYIVVATDANGCTTQDDVTVTVTKNNIVSAGADKVICSGNSTQLNASGGVLYMWSPALGLSDPTSATPTATPSTTTTYTVVVTDANGCSGTDEVTVDIESCTVTDPCASFTAIDYPDREICAGNFAQLSASGGVIYLWSPVAGLDNPTIANPTASPSSTTTYTVTVTNTDGCTVTDDITVTVNGSISVNAGADQLITDCEGSTAQMNATGGIFYIWSPATGLSNPAIPNPVASPSQTTIYTVEITDANGCNATDQVVVSVEGCSTTVEPDGDIDGDGITDNIEATLGTDPNDPCSNNYTAAELCAFIINNPNSPLATADCDNGGKSNIVECTNGANPLSATDDNPVTTEPDGDFDGDGITDNIEATLGTDPNDPCSNNYTAAELCAFITNNPNSPLATADCDNGGVINSVECARGSSPIDGADDNQTGNGTCDNFRIYECPDKRICVGGTAQLVVNGGVRWVWSPSTGLDNPTSDVPKASPTTTTTYTVTAYDANGCSASEQVVVTVVDQLKVYAGEDQSICGSESVQLDGQGGVQYVWSPTTGLSDPNIAKPIATPTATTTYTVTVTSPMGCTGTSQVTISIGGNLQANAGPDVTTCGGQATPLNASGGTTYQWSPTTGLSDPNIANPMANPSTTTNYSVTVSDASGCTGTDQVTVTVDNQLVVKACEDKEICQGGSVELLVTNGATYQWSPATGLSSTSIANPVANPTSTTTYSVTVRDANGCEGTDQVTVIVTPGDAVDAGQDVTTCDGQSAQLNASGGVAYVWSPATGLSSTTIANPSASPASTTTYTVTVTNAQGCTNTDQVTVTISNFNVEACEDKEMCVGENTRLLVSSGASYQWEPAATLDDPTSPAPMASPSHTTTYFVTVTDANGCTGVDDVILYVHDNNSANAGEDISECPNVGTQLNATGGMSYEWSPKEGLSDPFIANPFANPTQTTTYTVEIMDFNGCMATDQLVYEISTDCTPPPCQGQIVDQEEVCVDTDNMGRICLPMTVAELAANYTVTTSEGVITPNHGCDFEPLYAYPYAILPNQGGNGSYTIESWVVNGTTFNGIVVNNMNELATWMQTQDPTGNWTNVTSSSFIQGGNPLSSYGNLSIMHEETWIETKLTPSYTGIAMGTLLEIDMTGKDSEIITITSLSDNCTDEITINRCNTTPRCLQNLSDELYEVTLTDCNEMGNICIPVSLGSILDYDILVNGSPYKNGLQGCYATTTFTYTYFSIPDQGAKGPYQVNAWTINDNTFSGTVTDLAELVSWMNDKDATGNWIIDAATLSIQGGSKNTTYGKMEIVQINTRSKATLDVNTRLSADGTELKFAEGSHEVQLFNTNNGCSHQFTVIVTCGEGNLAPVATSDQLTSRSEETTVLDITANDLAIATSIEIIQEPAHGRAFINADNTVSYEANEGYCNTDTPDSFRYRICNENGCDEAEVQVTVDCPTMEVNKGFSPNGDGINDYLTIQGLENYPNNELTIFNRWGSVIFSQKGYDGQWDGSFDGLPLPDGTYFYILKDGKEKSTSGYIQINR